MNDAEIKRLVVVGGVAAGMSAASQAKRRRPGLEVIVLEQGGWVSYGACGMPYNIEDPGRRIDDLVAWPPERLRAERGLDVRLQSKVISVDLAGRSLRVDRPGGQSEFGWDRLVLATGCRPVHPPLEGMELAGVFVLHTLDQADAIKHWLQGRDLRRAVVIGTGHIGLEMADVLTGRGLAVTLLGRSESVPSGVSPEIGRVIRAELERYGVELRTGVTPLGFDGDQRVRRVLTSADPVPADLVIVATGVAPAVELARAAGIRLGESGAIAVDEYLRTSAPGVFAAGDCAEAHHRLLGRGMFLPRGTTANKQGRIAGANAVGAQERFRGVLGTSVMRIFGLAAGRTGLSDEQARQAGFDPASVVIQARSRAASYPGSKEITVRLVFARDTGLLLGAEMVGGEGVAKRIDVLATALSAGFDVEELASLDLSYAPPFAPVWDPILVAANIARKKVR